jgi:hypothetical protein
MTSKATLQSRFRFVNSYLCPHSVLIVATKAPAETRRIGLFSVLVQVCQCQALEFQLMLGI